MDTHDTAIANLADFVAATAGRPGEVERIAGGLAVASPFPMAHGFVTAAFRIDPAIPAADFLGEADAFFTARQRDWVVWVTGPDGELSGQA